MCGAGAAVHDARDLERAIVAQVNIVRRSFRLRKLTLSSRLTLAARSHARQLALCGYFSHDWPDGAPFGRWIRRFYPVGRARLWSAGENLLWAAPTVEPRRAVALWLASPEHRRILLAPGWRELGLGAVQVDNAGGVYGGQDVVIAAAEFGVRR